MHYIFL